MITKNIIIDNVKTIFYALVIAIVIRSLFIQPFYIPSSSMEPTLLIGDRLFVTKYSYGYSKHSFPFSPSIINGRLFSKKPKVGDVIVFKTPADNSTDDVRKNMDVSMWVSENSRADGNMTAACRTNDGLQWR